MATYNKEYRWNPPRRKKQRYALVERVVDFSKAPVTAGMMADDGIGTVVTTAWASGDILEAIQIRAGQTVMGVEFELIKRAEDANAIVKIGYGSDDDYWGIYQIAPGKPIKERAQAKVVGSHKDDQRNFGNPLYFASADTIDIKLNSAITTGRIRLIVHLLEDDR
jgi:hypothetical protein